MWMELNEMELNWREDQLNSTPRLKLRLTTFYGSGVYGTHESEMVGQRKRNRKVA